MSETTPDQTDDLTMVINYCKEIRQILVDPFLKVADQQREITHLRIRIGNLEKDDYDDIGFLRKNVEKITKNVEKMAKGVGNSDDDDDYSHRNRW